MLSSLKAARVRWWSVCNSDSMLINAASMHLPGLHLRDGREDGVLDFLGYAIDDPAEARPKQCSCCSSNGCFAGAISEAVDGSFEVEGSYQTCMQTRRVSKRLDVIQGWLSIKMQLLLTQSLMPLWHAISENLPDLPYAGSLYKLSELQLTPSVRI